MQFTGENNNYVAYDTCQSIYFTTIGSLCRGKNIVMKPDNNWHSKEFLDSLGLPLDIHIMDSHSYWHTFLKIYWNKWDKPPSSGWFVYVSIAKVTSAVFELSLVYIFWLQPPPLRGVLWHVTHTPPGRPVQVNPTSAGCAVVGVCVSSAAPAVPLALTALVLPRPGPRRQVTAQLDALALPDRTYNKFIYYHYRMCNIIALPTINIWQAIEFFLDTEFLVREIGDRKIFYKLLKWETGDRKDIIGRKLTNVALHSETNEINYT